MITEDIPRYNHGEPSRAKASSNKNCIVIVILDKNSHRQVYFHSTEIFIMAQRSALIIGSRTFVIMNRHLIGSPELNSSESRRACG